MPWRERGSLLLEPRHRLVTRRVEKHAAALDEQRAIGDGERTGRPLLGEEHRRTVESAAEVCEEAVGAVRVELRRRLVQQQELRAERERGRETHALELAARELVRAPCREVERADGVERGLGARSDRVGGRRDVLEPERDLVEDACHHDLVVRVLEDGRHRPGEVGGTRAPRVETGDLHRALEPAAVKMRDEPCERAHQRRLARAGGTEHRDDLARLDAQGHVLERRRRGAGVGERQAVDAR